MSQELIKKYNPGRLFFSNNPKSSIENADVIFIAVGTP